MATTAATALPPADTRPAADAASAVETGRWRRLAGLGAYLVVGAPVAVGAAADPSVLGDRTVLTWLGAYVLFGAAYWVTGRVLSRGARVAALGVQTVAALAANAELPLAFGGVAIGGVLLVIVAAGLVDAVSRRVAVGWVLLQSAALGVVYTGHGWPIVVAALAGAAFLTLQFFALLMAHTAQTEAASRRALARALAELQATQALLAESMRVAERARMSRELHDVMGHHLTALSLNLEAASHLATGRAAELVRRARGLSSLLLADVRAALSDGGAAGDSVDLLAALGALAGRLPTPEVTIDVPESARFMPPGVGQAFLRCSQEFLTNTLRHAGARTVEIRVRREGGELRLEARDDGRGAAAVRPGAGLNGIRERIEEIGGRLELRSSPGTGFRLVATVPDGGEGHANAPRGEDTA